MTKPNPHGFSLAKPVLIAQGDFFDENRGFEDSYQELEVNDYLWLDAYGQDCQPEDSEPNTDDNGDDSDDNASRYTCASEDAQEPMVDDPDDHSVQWIDNPDGTSSPWQWYETPEGTWQCYLTYFEEYESGDDTTSCDEEAEEEHLDEMAKVYITTHEEGIGQEASQISDAQWEKMKQAYIATTREKRKKNGQYKKKKKGSGK